MMSKFNAQLFCERQNTAFAHTIIAGELILTCSMRSHRRNHDDRSSTRLGGIDGFGLFDHLSRRQLC